MGVEKLKKLGFEDDDIMYLFSTNDHADKLND